MSTEAEVHVLSHVLRENHKSEGRNALEHCHDGATIYFPSTNQAFFSSLPLSDFSSHADNIPCSPSGHEVEVYDELHPYNKKTQHHFHTGSNLLCFFGSGLHFWDPSQRLGFCFNTSAINPSFITSKDVLSKVVVVAAVIIIVVV